MNLYCPAYRALSYAVVGLTITLALLTSCKTSSEHIEEGRVVDAEILVGRGYRFYPTPRTYDSAGQVYRVDSDRHIWPVGRITIQPETGQEFLGSLRVRERWSLSALLTCLGVNADALPASLNLAAGGVSGSVFEGTHGTTLRYSDYQQPARAAKDVIRRAGGYNAADTYYIIRESIACTNVAYSIGRGVHLSADATLTISEALKASGGGLLQRGNSLVVIGTFPMPMNLLYKAERLSPEIETGVAAGGLPDFKLEPAPEFALQ
jgi:hypothetical protein